MAALFNVIDRKLVPDPFDHVSYTVHQLLNKNLHDIEDLQLVLHCQGEISIIVLLKFANFRQSDHSNWAMWQAPDPCHRPGRDGL